MSEALWIVLGVATGAPLVVGLMPIAGRHLPERALHGFLGATAGVLLGVAFLDLIPEAIEAGGHEVGTTLGVSFVGLYVIEWVMGVHGHGAHGPEGHHEHDHFASTVRFPAVALVALGIHTFIDGLVLPSAFEAGTTVGITAGLAIAAHKVPDGFAAGTILVARGGSPGKVALGVTVIALLTPLGALVGLPLAGEPAWFPHVLAVAAGTFVFVAAAELLPELHHGPHKRTVIAGTLVGFALVWVLGQVVGHA